MSNKQTLEAEYKHAREALRAKLNDVISELERLQTEAIDLGKQEKADQYNDHLQAASKAKMLLIMTRIHELTQTDAVQNAIDQIRGAQARIEETLQDEGLQDTGKLDMIKGTIQGVSELLAGIQSELNTEK
jgi:hypothetical protein